MKKLRRFETMMWLAIRYAIYVSLMFIFIGILGTENIALTRLSRTLGITLSTYAVVGILFLTIYGKYDVGRRKSKPIIYSMILAVLCTDAIVYLQLMVMNTNVPSIHAFRLSSIGACIAAYIVQVVFIVISVYAGNALFFKLHKPESCYVITSSQESLNQIVRGITKMQKQYHIEKVLDYKDPELIKKLRDADTVMMYDIPIDVRSKVVSYCYKTRKNLYFNPEIEDIVEKISEYYLLDDITMLNYNVKGLTMEQRIAKRCLDIAFALVVGIVSSPIWIVSAIAIKLNDGGSILFKQDRATIWGNVFQVYKFRTMRENVENRSVTDNDDRITKVGKILRKTRMDELPQLLNILKGDMSVVGPRPEMLENVESYTEELPEFAYRLRMKAGLTGYAQISGKYNTTPKDKLMMDLMYIEGYSFFKDIQLLFQTLIVLLKSDSTEAFHNGEHGNKYVFQEVKEKE